MKKKGVILFTVFLLSLVLISTVFAQNKRSARGDIYVGTIQIQNMATLSMYGEWNVKTEMRHHSLASAKAEIRGDFGFPSDSDFREINGVRHKIIWNIRPE